MENNLNAKLAKFVCIKQCKLSGHRDEINKGDIFYANIIQWRTCTYIDVYLDDKIKKYNLPYGIGKSYDFVPFYKFREQQIDSILYD